MTENHWPVIPGVFAQVLQESALLLQRDHNRGRTEPETFISSGRFVSRRGPRRLDPRRGGRNPKKASNRASVCRAHDSLEENRPLSERDPAGCGARPGKQSQRQLRRGGRRRRSLRTTLSSRRAADTSPSVCQLRAEERALGVAGI